MYWIVQFLTIGVVIALTYTVFQAFGRRRATLLFRLDERSRWSRILATRLGDWFTASNLIGTLTSVASVYLLFLGSSRQFGAWIFICAFAIWLGAPITNYITRKVAANPAFAAVMSSPDQIGGVISSVFWRPTHHGRQVASAVRWISLANISAILWLDFALFIRISARLIEVTDIRLIFALGFALSFSVLFFTLKYGLRGFVFADLFQVPLVLLSALTLFGGSMIVFLSRQHRRASLFTILSPALPRSIWLPFVFHVVFLNLFMVVVTEPHWLRYWFFGPKETELQKTSTGLTALLWLIIMSVGLLGGVLTNRGPGDDTIVGLMQILTNMSPVYLSAFWAGAVAALFSSADSQIYSFLIVRQFRTKTGRLADRTIESIRPGLVSAWIAMVFASSYALVAYTGIPFEKIIFIIIPGSLNILPAFVLLIRRGIVHPGWIWTSTGLYSCVALIGLLQPAYEYTWTLMAGLVPLAISVAAFMMSALLPEEALYVEAQ